MMTSMRATVMVTIDSNNRGCRSRWKFLLRIEENPDPDSCTKKLMKI